VLAVHGRREDALHNISSLIVQVEFGDHVQLRFAEDGACEDFLSCDVPGIPTDGRNSIFRALALYRQVYDFPQRVVIRLEKNIPLESGLGGGSSDAALFLRHLNEMLGRPVRDAELMAIAGYVGSDCPSFLSSSPCVVRETGSRVEPVEVAQLQGLRRMKLIIFKPVVGIPTAWAYEQLDRKGPAAFSEATAANFAIENVLRELETKARPASLANAFQTLVSERFLELQLIFRDLDIFFRVQGYLTGTGSAGYIPLHEDEDGSSIRQYLTDVLGDAALIVETRPLVLDRRDRLAFSE
jgi:4-diphosphocytidyl-2-C-methyl-D-erythritol kinase